MDHEKFKSRVRDSVESGRVLVTLEDPARLQLPDFVISLGVPAAGLLLEAWRNHTKEEQIELMGVAPEPAYLRPPHITQAK